MTIATVERKSYVAFCASHRIRGPVHEYVPFDPNVPYDNEHPILNGADAYNAAKNDQSTLSCLTQFPDREHSVVILEEAV